jgi:hypothetical protein
MFAVDTVTPTPEASFIIRGYNPVIIVTVGKNQQTAIFVDRGVAAFDTKVDKTDDPK